MYRCFGGGYVLIDELTIVKVKQHSFGADLGAINGREHGPKGVNFEDKCNRFPSSTVNN